jgi:hypothetical protein
MKADSLYLSGTLLCNPIRNRLEGELMMEPELKQGVSLVAGCFGFFLFLVIVLLFALIHCKIFSKAGYPWALGLLMLVPIANLVMLLVLAFGDWPIHREMRLLRQQQNAPPQA